MAYTTKIKSVQLHDFIVIASPWDSISYIIYIHYITPSDKWSTMSLCPRHVNLTGSVTSVGDYDISDRVDQPQIDHEPVRSSGSIVRIRTRTVRSHGIRVPVNCSSRSPAIPRGTLSGWLTECQITFSWNKWSSTLILRITMEVITNNANAVYFSI